LRGGFNLVKCEECKKEFELLTGTHLRSHGMSTYEYRNKYPNSSLGYKEIIERKKVTCLKNYGVTNPSKSKLILKRMQKTCSENYGTKNPQHSKYIKIKKFENLKKRNPFLFMIEDIKIDKNGDPLGHCKNHLCENSKEQGGWFKLTYLQIRNRITNLNIGTGCGDYFYCSEECKTICPLYGIRSDPYKKPDKSHTQEENQTFRNHVLNRDNHTCQFCGKKAKYVHHERPQKLEPFFSLDPDYAWSCCEKCHYEKGHSGECSTGNLANKIC